MTLRRTEAVVVETVDTDVCDQPVLPFDVVVHEPRRGVVANRCVLITARVHREPPPLVTVHHVLLQPLVSHQCSTHAAQPTSCMGGPVSRRRRRRVAIIAQEHLWMQETGQLIPSYTQAIHTHTHTHTHTRIHTAHTYSTHSTHYTHFSPPHRLSFSLFSL